MIVLLDTTPYIVWAVLTDTVGMWGGGSIGKNMVKFTTVCIEIFVLELSASCECLCRYCSLTDVYTNGHR